jgi:hypothetical protein
MNDDELGAQVGAALREIYPKGPNDTENEYGWVTTTAPRAARRAPRAGRWLPIGLATVFVVALAVTLSLRLSGSPNPSPPTHVPGASATTGPLPPIASPTTASGLRRWGHAGLIIHFPASWVATNFRGAPAPTAFPLVYLSEYHLGGPCPADGAPPSNVPGPTTCFNGPDVVPDNAVIIRWLKIELPTSSADDQPGRRVTIDHRQARIQSSRSEVDAAIPLTTDPRDYEYFEMQASFGAHAPHSDRAAVYTMLNTLRITP